MRSTTHGNRAAAVLAAAAARELVRSKVLLLTFLAAVKDEPAFGASKGRWSTTHTSLLRAVVSLLRHSHRHRHRYRHCNHYRHRHRHRHRQRHRSCSSPVLE